MPKWPDLATAVVHLRTYLSDGPTDRPVKQKLLIGDADGTNTDFEAMEERIVPGTVFVTVDFTPVSSTLTDPVLGLISITPPPGRGQVVRGRYYYQYFLDSELQEAIINSMGQFGPVDDPTQVDMGLQQAVLAYAGYFAYTKQSIRWVQRMSQKFLLEEDPINAEVNARSNLFKQLAKGFMDDARMMRDDFYKRQSRQLAPAAAMFKPRIPWIGPRR